MRPISVERLTSGMVVARTIFGANGEVLLAKGVSLNELYIKRLQELEISALYISDELIGDIEVDDVINEQTRLEAKQLTRQTMQDVKVGAKFNLEKVNQVLDSIIDEIMNNKNLLICLVDIRAMNDYTFAHSVNVAVLSVVTGMAMGYPRNKLKQLAVGALFHDLGKALINAEVIVNTNSIKDAEDVDEEYQGHTRLGFDILRKNSNVSLLSAHVAFQHHERIDGKGYPRKLTGNEISEYAKIVAIANVYDNIISNASEKGPFSSQYAMEFITLNSGTWFDPDFVKTFVENVAVFPVGTMVELNTGEKGIVTAVNKVFPTRPTVRVLKDVNGTIIKPPYEIDLMEAHTTFLSKIIYGDEF